MTVTDLLNAPEVLDEKPGGSGSSSLSPRERQVIDIIDSGRSQKETAFELGVADATVRVLYARAMKKLGRTRRIANKLPANS